MEEDMRVDKISSPLKNTSIKFKTHTDFSKFMPAVTYYNALKYNRNLIK
jgi:hypothetical protein